MIWFTSDTHFNHSNICRGTSKWDGDLKSSTRDFESLDKMNAALVAGINKNVMHDDVLYHLGDWSFGGADSIWGFREQLIVKTIHLVFGNHDDHIRKNRTFPAGLAHDLFASVQDVLTVKLDGRTFFMSHYAHRIWDQSARGRLHLFGHSHGSLDDSEWGRSMDVGVDSAFKRFGEYRPFALKEITDTLDKREILIVDQHNTNRK